MDIVEFLRARLDEDEAVARAAIDEDRPAVHWMWEQVDGEPGDPLWLRTVEEFPTISGVGDLPAFPLGYDVLVGESLPAMPHIARHDPARVLREVEAKRDAVRAAERVLFPSQSRRGDFWDGQRAYAEASLRILASVYADHPDYDPEWAS